MMVIWVGELLYKDYKAYLITLLRFTEYEYSSKAL